MRHRRPIHVQLVDDRLPALPSNDQLELLRAAVLPEAEDARRAWAGWRQGGGTIEVVDMPTFRLLPLIYRKLEEIGVDDPDLLRLKGIYRHSWVTRQRLIHGVRPALDALGEARIPTMVLKGIAVALLHYGDLGVRPMDDVDVLVPEEQAAEAIHVLRRTGWTFQAEIPMTRMLRSRHAWNGAGASGAAVDLHWRVLPESGRDGGFWQRAVPVTVGGAPTVAPSPADQLLHTCVHAISYVTAPLRWIADAMAIITTQRPGVDWRVLVDEARQRRVSLKTATALGALREAMGAQIPVEVIDELRATCSGPAELLNHRVALGQFRGQFYVGAWATHRALRAGQATAVPRSLLQYLADVRELPTRSAVIRSAARNALVVSR